MENKKTIQYLNSKAWYRLLKVFYVAVFCLITLALIFIIYKAQDNPKKYKISCTWNKQSYVNEDVWADQPFSSNIGKWSREDRLAAAAGCLTDSERDMFHKKVEEFEKVIPPTYPSPGFAYDSETMTNMSINALYVMGIDVQNNDSFKVTTNIEMIRGVLSYFGIFLASLLIEFIIFEAIKRIFYYIILGTIKPEK